MRKDSVEAIFRALNAASVRYLVAGGLAVVAHGYLRSTVDVDLLLDLDPGNVQRALTALKQLGYRPRAPVPLEQFADPQSRTRWITEKGLTVFSLFSENHPETEIDLFVRSPIDFQNAYPSAHRAKLDDDVEVFFVPYADLINMKQPAGRPQDRVDIQELESARSQEHG